MAQLGSKAWKNIWRKKPMPSSVNEDHSGLARVLGPLDLMVFGVGSIVGAGIFVLTGVAARENAGPAVCLSFLLDAVACLFSALCYAELASRVPVAGSAFSYAYVIMGEGPAVIIGWAILLEYALSISAIARGVSGYLAEFIRSVGGHVPRWLSGGDENTSTDGETSLFAVDWVAAAAVFAVTAVLLLGMKQSRNVNTVITMISIGIVVFVIGFGAAYVETKNWKPFTPFGVQGIFSGASVIFFAFVGFDVRFKFVGLTRERITANCAEEVKRPARDLPLGLLLSLVIVGFLYVGVALVVTGLQPYDQLDLDAPLAEAFRARGVSWASTVVSVGALASLVTSMLSSELGSARIVYALAREGLLPIGLSKVGKWAKVPWVATLAVGGITMIMALLLDIGSLSEMVSAGTLVAFLCVCIAVAFLRLQEGNDQGASGGRLPDRQVEVQKQFLTGGIIAVICLVAATSVAARGIGLNGQPLPYWAIGICAVLAAGSIIAWSVVYLYFKKSNELLLRTVEPLREEDADASILVKSKKGFRCPFIPFTPLAGVVINTYLLTSLSAVAWIGFTCWTALGLVIYFAFGMWHSRLGDETAPFIPPSDELIDE